MSATATTQVFPARDYDLAATLSSGQAFRWRSCGPIWTGIVRGRWVRLLAGKDAGAPGELLAGRDAGAPGGLLAGRDAGAPGGLLAGKDAGAPGELLAGKDAGAPSGQQTELMGIRAEVAAPVSDWHWLTHYLQLDLDLAAVLRTFPDDPPMRAAVSACRGLRLLRQDPWECLASFILSSTKQIVQIQQIVALLCERYGEPVAVPPGQAPTHAFPSPTRLADAIEADLRACKMGFRAPYLLATARQIASGQCNLQRLQDLPVETARAELMQLPGVGRKIADCVLLFAYGFQSAFPVDVWVMKALQQLYFPRRRVPLARLHRFAAEHFGPNAGYAQQYLFHYMRTRAAPS